MNKTIIKVVSDLHLEFYRSLSDVKHIDNIIKKCNANVLALCGDIGNPMHKPEILKEFLSKVSANYNHVLYIPGNHEYYNILRGNTYDMTTVNNYLDELCNQYNIKFLNNKTETINGIKFIGSTLWSKIDIDKYNYIKRSLNDYYLIYKNNDDLFTPDDSDKLHSNSVKFIEDEIKDSISINKPCVVLTHHAPLIDAYKTDENKIETCALQYQGNKLSSAFGTHLPYLFIPNTVKLWAFGHTHYAKQFLFNKVPVVTNQLGYSRELGINFNPDLEIEINP